MNSVNILDFGAKPNIENQTEQIQKTIDYCFKNGGGEVIIPQGKFFTGGIRLRSNVFLHLQKNAELIGSRNPNDYNIIRFDVIEPIKEDDFTDILWKPVGERINYDHINKCGSSWNNALIKAIDAENIGIIGEKGATINGRDCYDENGEEHYRGPHAINFHRCSNILFKGYTVKNSANWAHALFDCKNISVKNIKVEGGHDGIHITSCDNTIISDSEFYTGDDCIAGIDNVNTIVKNCILNTACSAFRFGGTNVKINSCKMYGPAKYLFRGSMSTEEKKNGVASGEGHRYNMLSAFTYYSDFSRKIRYTPSNIIISDCKIENSDRFLHYNFSGNEPWQCNKPLRDITFSGVTATNIAYPLNAYGSNDTPIRLTISDSQIAFANPEKKEFMRLYGYEKVVLKNLKIKNTNTAPLIKQWSENGEIILDNVECDEKIKQISCLCTEKFFTPAI